MRLKICGITQPEQAIAIAQLGIQTLGFICVTRSPRYVTPEQIAPISQALPAEVAKIGVFVNAPLETVVTTVSTSGLTGIQLHGEETPEHCQALRTRLPAVEMIKALRIREPGDLDAIAPFLPVVDTVLLDAYHPHLYGGTGETLNWQDLQDFRPAKPWLLAGGITPDNVEQALALLQPDGLDVSSGVERSPGDKDLRKVQALFTAVQAH
jgi:phosphoribosylanthranilate isomerase